MVKPRDIGKLKTVFRTDLVQLLEMVMDDFKLSIVMFLVQSGFVLGQDFSMDANGDLIIGSPETFSALSAFMDSIS